MCNQRHSFKSGCQAVHLPYARGSADAPAEQQCIHWNAFKRIRSALKCFGMCGYWEEKIYLKTCCITNCNCNLQYLHPWEKLQNTFWYLPTTKKTTTNECGSNKTKVALNMFYISLVFSRVWTKQKVFCQRPVCQSKWLKTLWTISLWIKIYCGPGYDVLYDETSFCDLWYSFTRKQS